MSLAIAFLNLMIYIFFGALMFVKEEDWGYLNAVYFIFTSISTIGYGDIMPSVSVSLAAPNDFSCE